MSSDSQDIQKLEKILENAKLENTRLSQDYVDYQQQRTERMKEFEEKIKELSPSDDYNPKFDALLALAKDQDVRINQLAQQLLHQTQKADSLKNQNEQLKRAICALQSSTEAEEEYITNMLMKRIEGLKNEKQELLTKLEAEEEMITNQLQRKLQQLQKEKIQMEITLEQEQECMVNRLQKQLDDLRGPVTPRSRLASTDSKASIPNLPSTLSISGKWNSGTSLSDIGPSTAVVEMLKAENSNLRTKLDEVKIMADAWAKEAMRLYAKLYHAAQPRLDPAVLAEFREELRPLPFKPSSSPILSDLPSPLSAPTTPSHTRDRSGASKRLSIRTPLP